MSMIQDLAYARSRSADQQTADTRYLLSRDAGQLATMYPGESITGGPTSPNFSIAPSGPNYSWLSQAWGALTGGSQAPAAPRTPLLGGFSGPVGGGAVGGAIQGAGQTNPVGGALGGAIGGAIGGRFGFPTIGGAIGSFFGGGGSGGSPVGGTGGFGLPGSGVGGSLPVILGGTPNPPSIPNTTAIWVIGQGGKTIGAEVIDQHGRIVGTWRYSRTKGWVFKSGSWGSRRKMNVMNPHALSRANRRVTGFAHKAGSVLKHLGFHVSSTRHVKGVKASGKRRRK